MKSSRSIGFFFFFLDPPLLVEFFPWRPVGFGRPSGISVLRGVFLSLWPWLGSFFPCLSFFFVKTPRSPCSTHLPGRRLPFCLTSRFLILFLFLGRWRSLLLPSASGKTIPLFFSRKPDYFGLLPPAVVFPCISRSCLFWD